MALFPDFEAEHFDLGRITLFVRHGGNVEKPPLILLHGYPQTSAMWHGVVQRLQDDFYIICPDLRGYGQSDKPPTTADHTPYSKREMAADISALIKEMGHESAFIGAHDRGARVAHRLGMDHPATVRSMVLLDIAPTREMYATGGDEFARAYWHWYFLIQKHPLPETLIGSDPRAFWKMKCLGLTNGLNPFHPEALEEYLSAFEGPNTVHANCEDYRAAATIDITHDDADNGRKLEMPVRVFWAAEGVIERCFDALGLWKQRAKDVSGEALPGTHYFAEEIPDQIADRMRSFFQAN